MPGTEGQIDYEGLVAEAMREAMRGVLRRVLIDVVKNGLPGDHHFYISFKTNEPGVSLSTRLLERYPDEMTIVLQHRFWDLAVHADRFEVKLQFNSIPERLVIPFDAIRVFVDPSVRFGHQFDDLEAGSAADDAASPAVKGAARNGAGRASNTGARAERRRPAPRGKGREREADVIAMDERGEAATHRSTGPATSAPAQDAATASADTTAPAAAPTSAPSGGDANVISLDKFRKK